MRHRFFGKASRNIGLVVTVSARALKVAMRMSFRDFDHRCSLHGLPSMCPEPCIYVERGRIPGIPNSSEVISQTSASINCAGASSMNSVKSQFSFPSR
jgi:hypothetical protein